MPSLEAALTEIEHQSTAVPGSVEHVQPNATDRDIDAGAQSRAACKHKANELQAIMRSISDEEGRKIVIFATSDFGLYPRGGEVRGNMLYGGARRSRDGKVSRGRGAHRERARHHHLSDLSGRPGVDVVRRHAQRGRPRGRTCFARRTTTVLLNQTARPRRAGRRDRRSHGLGQRGDRGAPAARSRRPQHATTRWPITTPATGTTRSRDIIVRAKNRDYQVRSRREYVEKTDVTRMQDRVIANLFRPDRRERSPLRVEFGALEKAAGRRWSVPLKIEVPSSAFDSSRRRRLVLRLRGHRRHDRRDERDPATRASDSAAESACRVRSISPTKSR